MAGRPDKLMVVGELMGGTEGRVALLFFKSVYILYNTEYLTKIKVLYLNLLAFCLSNENV